MNLSQNMYIDKPKKNMDYILCFICHHRLEMENYVIVIYYSN